MLQSGSMTIMHRGVRATQTMQLSNLDACAGFRIYSIRRFGLEILFLIQIFRLLSIKVKQKLSLFVEKIQSFQKQS